MLIDCDACRARGPACGGCVVNLVLGGAAPPAPDEPGEVVELDRAERVALDVLASRGLVPPLRYEADDEGRPVPVLPPGVVVELVRDERVYRRMDAPTATSPGMRPHRLPRSVRVVTEDRRGVVGGGRGGPTVIPPDEERRDVS